MYCLRRDPQPSPWWLTVRASATQTLPRQRASRPWLGTSRHARSGYSGWDPRSRWCTHCKPFQAKTSGMQNTYILNINNAHQLASLCLTNARDGRPYLSSYSCLWCFSVYYCAKTKGGRGGPPISSENLQTILLRLADWTQIWQFEDVLITTHIIFWDLRICNLQNKLFFADWKLSQFRECIIFLLKSISLKCSRFH